MKILHGCGHSFHKYGCEANADIDENENDDDEVIISESNVSTSIVDARLQLQQEFFSWGLVPGPDI